MRLEIISIDGGDEVITLQVWLLDENRLVDTFDITITFDDIQFNADTLEIDKAHLATLLSNRIRRIQILRQVEEGMEIPFIEKRTIIGSKLAYGTIDAKDVKSITM